jgi:AcrR family transcriptional regulator
MFRNLIDDLKEDYHLVAPDYPGFGNSEQPPINEFEYTFDHFAELIEAAVTLFIRQGVRKTSIKQIADTAGVAVGTVYLYYADKTAIVRAVAFAFADNHAAFVDQVAGDSNEPLLKLERYLLGLYDLWQPFEENQAGPVDLAEAIMTHAGETLQIAADQFHQAFSQFLSEARESGLRVDDPQAEAKWVALATLAFYPLAGTQSEHPLRSQLKRDDLAGLIRWLSGKFQV